MVQILLSCRENNISTKHLHDMSEVFDNSGVMPLLHRKRMRDAEVATVHQLMLANSEDEESP